MFCRFVFFRYLDFMFVALADVVPGFNFSWEILFLHASVFVCALFLLAYNYIYLVRGPLFIFTRIFFRYK